MTEALLDRAGSRPDDVITLDVTFGTTAVLDDGTHRVPDAVLLDSFAPRRPRLVFPVEGLD